MPWDHCNVEFILDDERCPECGLEKANWTVQVDRTRELRIRRPRREVTLRDFGETLRDVHAREGLIVARRLAAALDFDALTALARRWRDDPSRQRDNDPNTWVHPRYLLLPYMDEALLPPDALDGVWPDDDAGPIVELCRAISWAGVPCKESTVFDDEVLAAYTAWRALAPRPSAVPAG